MRVPGQRATDVPQDIREPAMPGSCEIAARVLAPTGGDCDRSEVWEVARQADSPLHPTTKPLALMGRTLRSPAVRRSPGRRRSGSMADNVVA